MNSYQTFHIELMQQTYNQIMQMQPFNHELISLQDQEFLESFVQLIVDFQQLNSGYIESGQDFCCTWVRAYPELVPVLPRDLLWYFGGDCLHYMPDEELDLFQLLDERHHLAQQAGTEFNYPDERAKVFQLH